MLVKRIFLGGIGLALAWLVLLTVPMWLRSVDHPLTANATVDVCAYLSDTVLAALPQAPEVVARGVPGEPNTRMSACHVILPSSSGGPSRAPGIWVAVETERMLTVDRRPQRTDRVVDTWLQESGASGSIVTPVKGPWRRAAIIQDPMHPGKLSLLADDAGVVVWVNGQGIDQTVFVAFAGAITRGLRRKLVTTAAVR
jgi:hypothetical protein